MLMDPGSNAAEHDLAAHTVRVASAVDAGASHTDACTWARPEPSRELQNPLV